MERQCAQRVASETGDRGGFRSLAAHVADDEPPSLAVDLEHVVEVAADFVALARGAVPAAATEGGVIIR